MAKTELKLLTYIDMLQMATKGIRGGIICHAIDRYEKANNEYMNDYNKIKELSYLMYWDANNLYGCVMSYKLPIDYFEWG